VAEPQSYQSSRPIAKAEDYDRIVVLGTDLVIRLATLADEPALTGFAQRLASFELPPWRTGDDIAGADGRQMMESVRTGQIDDQVFVAERAGEAVGCLHVLATTDFFGLRHAHVSVLATSEAAEGTGVGRALLAFAEDWTRDRNLPMLTLNVFATNARARRFYERAGMTPELLQYSKPM
jgi:GNAT superfamily N-acetyltransferase